MHCLTELERGIPPEFALEGCSTRRRKSFPVPSSARARLLCNPQGDAHPWFGAATKYSLG